jgi:hypothetical protein
MAKIVGCEVVSMESYDEFNTLDLPEMVGCEVIYGNYYKVE